MVGKITQRTCGTCFYILLQRIIPRCTIFALVGFVAVVENNGNLEFSRVTTVALRCTHCFGGQAQVTFFRVAFKGIELKNPTLFAIGRLVVVFGCFGCHQFFSCWAQLAGGTARHVLIFARGTRLAGSGNGRSNFVVVSSRRTRVTRGRFNGSSVISRQTSGAERWRRVVGVVSRGAGEADGGRGRWFVEASQAGGTSTVVCRGSFEVQWSLCRGAMEAGTGRAGRVGHVVALCG